MRKILFLMVWTMLSACATFGGSNSTTEGGDHASKSSKEGMKETPQVYGVNNKELELKLTKLWARVDEMEGELIRYKERIRLLEKGLLTGIVPAELSQQGSAKKNPSSEAMQVSADLEAPLAVVAKRESQEPPAVAVKTETQESPTSPEKGANEAQFQEAFSKAEKLYNEKHWGQAIAAYSALNVYPDEVTHGHHLYWTGMSWFNLKEYQLAMKHFDEFIQKFPGDPLVAKAHLYIAKGDLQMGFVEKGVNRLKNVMRDFPADEAAKMAKWEMSRIEQTL